MLSSYTLCDLEDQKESCYIKKEGERENKLHHFIWSNKKRKKEETSKNIKIKPAIASSSCFPDSYNQQ